jgi:hypothetical protein
MVDLKAYLYLQAREDLKDWDGQSPPKGTVPDFGPNVKLPNGLPKFGPYEKERRKIISEEMQKRSLNQGEDNQAIPPQPKY